MRREHQNFTRQRQIKWLRQRALLQCAQRLPNALIDDIAEHILNELNQGETDEATTLEIKPFTYRNINFPGYIYESSHNPILKGGRRRRRKSRRRNKRSRSKRSIRRKY